MSPPLPAVRPSRLTGLVAALTLVLLTAAPAAARSPDRAAAWVIGEGWGGVGAAPSADIGGIRWSWPTGAPARIGRPFIAPDTRYSAGHRGIDIDAPPGSAVLAVDDGTVHFAGTVVDRPLVSIRHGETVISSVEPVLPLVAEGEPVARGQPIGTVGTSEHCPGSCVHLGVRVHGEYVSPMLFLGELRPSVLLPTRAIG